MRIRKPARLRRWRDQWYVIWYDYLRDPPRERRTSCVSSGATTSVARAELLKRYLLKEKNDEMEAFRHGGALGFDTSLLDALELFRQHVQARGEMRRSNPKARQGLAQGSTENTLRVVDSFVTWLKSTGRQKLRTGQLDGVALQEFLGQIATESTKLGYRVCTRSISTINSYRRLIKVCLRWLDEMRPPLFPDFKIFKRALQEQREDVDSPVAFSPSELRTFLETALQREDPSYETDVCRIRRGKIERFKQKEPATSATPVSRIFLLLALTGCRLGEVLALRWEHLDLARGRITVRASKTGRTRIIPLVEAPEGSICPRFLSLLRQWAKDAGFQGFVLPHGNLEAPVFPKSAWQMANNAANLRRIGPQMLRQNFTSYGASLGIPASVCSLWQGHRLEVAERHYRAQVLDRQQGSSFEEAMGLAPLIETLLEAKARKSVS